MEEGGRLKCIRPRGPDLLAGSRHAQHRDPTGCLAQDHGQQRTSEATYEISLSGGTGRHTAEHEFLNADRCDSVRRPPDRGPRRISYQQATAVGQPLS